MSKVYNCVIIDDEPKAVSVLSSLIKQISEIREIASFTDPNLALSQIEDLNPDLIFLDIEMPEKMVLRLLMQSGCLACRLFSFLQPDMINSQ